MDEELKKYLISINIGLKIISWTLAFLTAFIVGTVIFA